jgi:hypothetical protein
MTGEIGSMKTYESLSSISKGRTELSEKKPGVG